MKAKDYRPFRIKRSKDNQYYVVIVARNNYVLFTSEMYTRKHNAKKSITACAFLSFQASLFDNFIDETLKK